MVPRWRWIRWIWLPVVAAAACREPTSSPEIAKSDAPSANGTATATAETAAPTVQSSAAPVVLPPLPSYQPLAVSGFESAVVSNPVGPSQTVVVATHGNFDSPDWQCEIFRGIVGAKAFVLCPRGMARPDSPSKTDIRFTYANNNALESEVLLGRTALRQTMADRLPNKPAIYAGFSLGAIMGITILSRSAPGTFDRAVLIEGGYDKITPDKAKAIAAAGIAKILFGCGQTACFAGAKSRMAMLAKAGIQSRVVGDPKAGHTYDGPVAQAVTAEWPWLTE